MNADGENQEDVDGTTPDRDDAGRAAMEGGDRERGDRGIGADEAGRRSHELSQGEYGPTTDYGDG